MGALVMGFASCKKDCKCTVTTSDDKTSLYEYGQISHTECGAKTAVLEQQYAAAGASLKKIDCRLQ